MGTISCNSYIFYVSEIPSYDFGCAYLGRHNMIFLCELSVIHFYKIRAINYIQQKPVLDNY